MEKPTHQFTREKHLDHLVRVVPLLTLAYGVQSWLMLQWAGEGPTGALLTLLGVSLAASVLGMVGYDQRHQVSWDEDGFRVRAPWKWGETVVARSQVAEVDVEGAEDEFQTVTVSFHGKRRKMTFWFVDNGHEFKAAMTAAPVEEKKAA